MNSKTTHERKNSHRKSWFIGNSLLNIFSSTPSSPEHKAIDDTMVIDNDIQHRKRSQSLTLTEDERNSNNRPLLKATSNKATFSSFFLPRSAIKRKSTMPSYSSSSSIISDANSSRRNSMNVYEDTITPLSTINDDLEPIQIFKVDEEEADRIQLKNDLIRLAFDGEFCLPFDYKDLPNGRVLDVGCGPGAWCIDLATKYPQLEVTGIDSDNMFPSECNLPLNCQLIVSNVLGGLKEFPEASYDVIHIRFMVLAFTLTQYPQVVKDCWRLLKPGGFIEILETDLIVYSPGPITSKLNEQMNEVAISKGLNPQKQIEKLKELLPEDSVDLEIKYRSIPMGVWGGRIGVLCRDDMINILTKFQPYVQSYYDVANEHFEQDLSIVTREMDQYKSFSNYYFCAAKKPFLNATASPTSLSDTLLQLQKRQHSRNSSEPWTQSEITTVNPKSF